MSRTFTGSTSTTASPGGGPTPPTAALDGELAVLVSAHTFLSGRAAELRPLQSRPDSTITELSVPACGQARRWIVKTHRQDPDDPRAAAARARHEYGVLLALARHFASLPWSRPPEHRGSRPAFDVPAPVSLHESIASVVMEPCTGVPLDSLIRESRFARRREAWAVLVSAVGKTGRWLRSFQRCPPLVDGGPSPLDSLASRAREDIGLCRDRGLEPPLGARALARLEELTQLADGRPCPTVGHHCDFWPGNVWVDDERVQVIDFEGYRRGLPYEDLAYFALHVELFFSYPFLERRGRSLSGVFVAEYLDGEALDTPMYDLCRLAKAVQVLSKSGGRGRGAARTERWRRRWLVRQVAMLARSRPEDASRPGARGVRQPVGRRGCAP